MRDAAGWQGSQAGRTVLRGELIEDPAGHEVAEGGGEVGGCSVAGVAFDSAGHFLGAFGGGASVAGGEFGLLGREDGGDFEFAGLFPGLGEAIPGTELFSDGEKEGVAKGFREVVDANLGGIGSTARSAAGDDGDVFFAAGGKEVALWADGVDGVDNDVRVCREEFLRVFFGVEGLPDLAMCAGVDRGDAGCEGSSFRLTDGLGSGVNLTVDIGEAEVVEIDKGEMAHPGASEGFDGPRTDSAQADDHDMAAGEFLQGRESVESRDSAEAIAKVIRHAVFLSPEVH